MSRGVHLALWIIVGIIGLINIQGVRYEVDAPGQCPATWGGEPVGAMELRRGQRTIYQCVVGDNLQNIAVGRKVGIPGWISFVLMVGAVVGYQATKQYVKPPPPKGG